MSLDKNGVIFLSGASGMVGSNFARLLQRRCFKNILTPAHHELDLTIAADVEAFFEKHHPNYVFMIAAKVGGIAANIADPVGFFVTNMKMQLNVFEACRKFGTRKNLFLGSSCIYPRESPQPMKEEYLLTGALEPTNEAYALAKIAGVKLSQFYRTEYGMVTINPMPCNIYGTNDSFDLERCHVLSALIRRFVDAKEANESSVTLWGTGSARREFIHVDDVADALLFLMERYDSPEIINVGTGVDLTVRELALLIAEEVGYRGSILWDPARPDGMPRKCLDISKLKNLGFSPRVDLPEGIRRTIDEYRHMKMAEQNS